MIPLRDDIPSRSRPVMNWTLIGINLAVFLVELTLPEESLRRVFASFGLVPAELSLWRPASLAALVTSAFLHGGLFHVLSNLWTLWIFGDNVEDRMGPWRYLAFYLGCGVAAGLIQAVADLDSTIPTVGASGAIAGVLGAYFVLYPSARVLTLIPIFFWPFFVQVPAFVYLGFWFLTQVLSGTISLADVQAAGIAWWAHVGGFVAGLLLHAVFLRQRAPAPVEIVVRRTPRRDSPEIW